MLTIIVPCYNEYNRLDIVLYERFITCNIGVQLLFVNDGSADNTSALLHELANKFPGRIFVLDLHRNVGKAEAIRMGCKHILDHFPEGYIGYIDADLSVPLDELMRIYHIMIEQHLLVIFASRVALFGADIQRTPHRHYLGRVFSTCASIILNTVIYDTQCGGKLFSHDIAQKIFQRPFVSRWFFDVEIIARLNQLYTHDGLLKILREIPLNTWIHRRQSKVRFKDFFLCPYYLIRIKLKYRLKTYSTNVSNEKKLSDRVPV
jgi:dolichyl-phosphate beta-glucosyltransferase